MRANAKLLLFLPLLALGLVSFVVVRAQQGQGATLVARQQQAEALTPARVAAVVRAAPDPNTNNRGRSAVCVPMGSGELHNPWHCAITYPSGRVIEYTVTLAASGAFTGDHQIVRYRGITTSGDGQIRGCCVVVP